MPYTLNQQHQGLDVQGHLVWLEPHRTVCHGNADDDRRSLWNRRRSANPVRIRGGIEFDAYAAGCAPCRELEAARVRVTYEEITDEPDI